MTAALVLLTVGGIMVYSALTGTSFKDVLAGKQTDTLDPQGGSKITSGVLSGATDTIGGAIDTALGKAGGIIGKFPTEPNADLLLDLNRLAVGQFHLKITATTNGSHVANSYHFQGRAFDASGSPADMQAFASYVTTHYTPQIKELIHNPGPCIKDGKLVNGATVYAAVWQGHRDHVHVAA